MTRRAVNIELVDHVRGNSIIGFLHLHCSRVDAVIVDDDIEHSGGIHVIVCPFICHSVSEEILFGKGREKAELVRFAFVSMQLEAQALPMSIQATLMVLNSWLEDPVGIASLEEAVAEALVEGMALVVLTALVIRIFARIILFVGVAVLEAVVAHVDERAVGKSKVVQNDFVCRVVAVPPVEQQVVVATQTSVIAVACITRLAFQNGSFRHVLFKDVANHLFDGSIGESAIFPVGTGRIGELGCEFAAELGHVRVMMILPPPVPKGTVVPVVIGEISMEREGGYVKVDWGERRNK